MGQKWADIPLPTITRMAQMPGCFPRVKGLATRIVSKKGGKYLQRVSGAIRPKALVRFVTSWLRKS